MKVLYLHFAIAFGVTQSRIYDPLEDDINYKRFQTLITKSGYQETVDLLGEEVSVRATEKEVTYYLYTRQNLDAPHPIKPSGSQKAIDSPHFDANKRTIVIIHGWVDSYTAEVNTLVKAATLKSHDVNIIVVDWSPVAALSYSAAQSAVVSIGTFIGNFVNKIIDDHGVNGNQLTIIGHSLGAHIAGNAGQVIKSKVSHIIGLDPAAPSFTVQNTANRLDPTDAQHVEIIHTNTRFLGFASSLGHVDNYPNGGSIQAGCGLDLLGGCSHARSFQYLAEAINGAQFTATQCGSYSDFQNNRCTNNKKIRMGLLDPDRSASGDFFLDTNTAAPYSKR